MADYEIFREQLAIMYPSYGYALWEPRPLNPNRPVQVGDVGFIRGGRFYRLFSALLPANDPSQELGVPEYHEPLVPTLSDHISTAPLDPNNYCSAGVKVTVEDGFHSSPDDFPQLLFQNETTRPAAVSSLPVTTRHEDTLIGNVFGRWMVKHIDTSFAFARNLGLVRQMEELILVTGRDLTRSWTNIAFLGGRADAQASFGVEVEGPTSSNPTINFQLSPGRVRGAVLHRGPEGMNLPENQCAFIRGFRVAPSLYFLPKRLKAAAGPSPDQGYDGDSDMEVISIPAITQIRDPLHFLSDYIAEQAPDCDKILVHDTDLFKLMINGIGHNPLPETLEPDVMVDLLRKSDIKIYKSECDSFLTENQSGPNTNTSYVKVASLSMTFQNWNPTSLSQWAPLAAQEIDLNHTSQLRGTPQPRIPGQHTTLSTYTKAPLLDTKSNIERGISPSPRSASNPPELHETFLKVEEIDGSLANPVYVQPSHAPTITTLLQSASLSSSAEVVTQPTPHTPPRGRSSYFSSLGLRIPLRRHGTSNTERLEGPLIEAGHKETRIFTPETPSSSSLDHPSVPSPAPTRRGAESERSREYNQQPSGHTENDLKYMCAECNLQFGTPRDLSRHLNKTARHGSQPGPCPICHKQLTRPDSRARHERRCRARFGVTEEMWQGIERERQRGRRKSISVDRVEPSELPGEDGGGRRSRASSVSSRCSRTPSISDV